MKKIINKVLPVSDTITTQENNGSNYGYRNPAFDSNQVSSNGHSNTNNHRNGLQTGRAEGDEDWESRNKAGQSPGRRRTEEEAAGDEELRSKAADQDGRAAFRDQRTNGTGKNGFGLQVTDKEEEEGDDEGRFSSSARRRRREKLWRMSWFAIRICLVFVLLYFFICSLDVLQDAFQLLGGRAAGNVFTNNALLNNPICGLMIGVLVTVLVQSSSTSTSIVVSMVGSGLLQVRQAIPIVMGANIGTTVTNTLVSLTQSADREMFRLAFAGATVHDMFNWLTVLILLPLEVATGYLYHLANAITQNIVATDNADIDNPQFLKVLTTPLTKRIVQLDKHVITAIAESRDRQKFPLLKYYCKEVKRKYAVEIGTELNATDIEEIRLRPFATDVGIRNVSGSETLTWTEVDDANSTKCSHLFAGCGLRGAALTEIASGLILMTLSLAAMIACLVAMVKTLGSLLHGPMAAALRRSINADFPGRAACLTPYAALVVGACVTVLVQSSSVFTSALTPLVGLRVVTVERVYPLTLGSNIGTTITSVLAALTTDPGMVRYTLQIAFCHLFFNVTGIVIFFPVPLLRRVPIDLAKRLGQVTSRYRWFAVVYLVLLYFLLPLAVFLLSLAGWFVLLAVGGPCLLLALFVVGVSVLQSRRPRWLLVRLRSWDFLPRPCRSLEPYDRVVTWCCRHETGPCRACLEREMQADDGASAKDDGASAKDDGASAKDDGASATTEDTNCSVN